MKISWIKAKSDKKSFCFQKNIGLDVYEIEDLDETDNKIEELINNNYNTIIISNEVAYFSGDLINKYVKNDNVNIIISGNKKRIIE